MPHANDSANRSSGHGTLVFDAPSVLRARHFLRAGVLCTAAQYSTEYSVLRWVLPTVQQLALLPCPRFQPLRLALRGSRRFQVLLRRDALELGRREHHLPVGDGLAVCRVELPVEAMLGAQM